MKHPKMDPLLIADKEPHEIEHVVKKLRKEGFKIKPVNVHKAVKAIGRSRRKVYNLLRLTLSK